DDPQFGPGAIRAQRWSESAGTWEGPLPGQVNTGIREVRVPAVLLSNAVVPSNEHIWALAYDNTPLPIQLISFDARAEENAWVRCSWITASEQDNDFFTVERSRDGIRFEEVGVVDGAGNSVSTLTYEFRDPGPYLGLSYYRLRQTDFDGSSSWSQAVAVTLTRDEGISVYPNPNNGRFTISRSEVGGPLDLELLDGAGRRIQAWRMTEGMVRLDVETDIASGIYTLRWLGGSAKVSVSR
ncbi:MAG: T9SS type A sorting domain-containing protein, partial [Flavobacteriales bacterium]|nr:T9SS type A sorting domain-containing protein [Flavobacteriales bacterium]